MTTLKEFKRINFFRGFLTTEEDWNSAEGYHVEKRMLHNSLLHAPGVVPNFLGGLKVTARGKNDLSVEVASGYAIDGAGHDLTLPEPVIITLNLRDYKLPQTVYFVLRYYEELSDPVVYKENLDYKGHKRIAERVKIFPSITEPDVMSEVEAARVHLEKDVRRISDAKNPFDPKANEIDMRYVPIAGIAGSYLPPVLIHELMELIYMKKRIYGHLAHVLGVKTASDLLHAVITFNMLLLGGYVDSRNIFVILNEIFDLQAELIKEIDSDFPELSARKEFALFKRNYTALAGMNFSMRFSTEILVSVFDYIKQEADALNSMFGEKVARKAVKKIEVPTEAIWEKAKVRSEEFTELLVIDGHEFKLVDFIDLLDTKSEKEHKFMISEEKDKYRSRQKLRYPDGVLVEDVGIHYEGGYAEWEVKNVMPNKDLVLVTRMDYVRGEYECEMYANGKKLPNLACAGNDMKFRWRNWPYVVSAEYVKDTGIRFKQVPITANRDVNMFKIWVYQPV